MIKIFNNIIKLYLYIQTKSKINQFNGIYQNRIKLKINKLPIKNQANKYLINFLSKKFQVPKNSILIKKGYLSQKKLIYVYKPKIIPVEISRLLKKNINLD